MRKLTADTRTEGCWISTSGVLKLCQSLGTRTTQRLENLQVMTNDDSRSLQWLLRQVNISLSLQRDGLAAYICSHIIPYIKFKLSALRVHLVTKALEVV